MNGTVTLQYQPKPPADGSESKKEGASFNLQGDTAVVLEGIKSIVKPAHLNEYFIFYTVNIEDNDAAANMGKEIIKLISPPA